MEVADAWLSTPDRKRRLSQDTDTGDEAPPFKYMPARHWRVSKQRDMMDMIIFQPWHSYRLNVPADWRHVQIGAKFAV
ncbi:unnamed protein product, partial [Brenthis ino]